MTATPLLGRLTLFRDILVPGKYTAFFVGPRYPVMPTGKKHGRFRKYVTLFNLFYLFFLFHNRLGDWLRNFKCLENLVECSVERVRWVQGKLLLQKANSFTNTLVLRKTIRMISAVTGHAQIRENEVNSLKAVLGIRIRKIRMFLGLPDPHPDLLVTSTDPAPDRSIIKQK